MKTCPECNKENSPNARYCNYCGANFEEISSVDEDDPAIHLFIGKKAPYYQEKWKKAEKRNGISFNVSAFLFSFLWLGYRKYYLPIGVFALASLGIDGLIYLSGYQQSLLAVSPIDRAINTAVAITFALYGNLLYKKHVVKEVQLIKNSTTDESKRKELYAKKGGTSWLGVVIAIIIMLVGYILPASFIPMNIDPIEEIQNAELEYIESQETKKVKVEEMFDRIFEQPNWEEIGDPAFERNIVRFEGDYGASHFTILFQVQNNTENIEIVRFLMDDEEIDFNEDFTAFDFLLELYFES